MQESRISALRRRGTGGVRAARWLLGGLAPLLLVTAAGCYNYVAIPPETAPPRAQVRAHLSAAAAAPAGFGLVRRDVLEGEVVEQRDQTLVLSIVPRDLGVQPWAHGPRDTVALRLNDIEALEEKRFSAARTAGAVVGAGVVGALLVRYLFGQWAGGTTQPPNGGPGEVLIPR